MDDDQADEADEEDLGGGDMFKKVMEMAKVAISPVLPVETASMTIQIGATPMVQMKGAKSPRNV